MIPRELDELTGGLWPEKQFLQHYRPEPIRDRRLTGASGKPLRVSNHFLQHSQSQRTLSFTSLEVCVPSHWPDMRCVLEPLANCM